MSRFVIITLLASFAITSAKPYIVTYSPEYYDSYDDYSYPYTPVRYVETYVRGPPPVDIVPVKLIAKNAGPPPPAPQAQLVPPMMSAPAPTPKPAPPPPPPPPAAAPSPPANTITITKTLPDLDPAKLLSALPIAQLLELPPVKQIVALKSSKLEALMGLKGALQDKLATLAALLP